MRPRVILSCIVLLAACVSATVGSSAGYYAAIAVLPLLHIRAVVGPRMNWAPRGMLSVFVLGVVPMTVIWGAVQGLGDEGLSAAKGTLLFLAPWVFIVAGHDLARRGMSLGLAATLVSAFAVIGGISSVYRQGSLTPLSLMSLSALFLVLRERRFRMAAASLLAVLAILLTTGGSRTALIFAFLEAAVLVFSEKASHRRLVAAGAVVSVSVVAAVLLSRNELFASKIAAGVGELAPSEFDANGYGGASNLRGYEGALVSRAMSVAGPEVIIFGGGPAYALESGVPIGDEGTTRLFVFHNALFTYLVKFGLWGLACVLVSFAMLATAMVRHGGPDGWKGVAMMCIASVVDGGAFSYVWMALWLSVGVFLAVPWRRGEGDASTAR